MEKEFLGLSHHVREILTNTCRIAVELFHADHSGLVFFEPDFENGRVVAEYPHTVGTVGERIPIHGIPAEHDLIANKEPVVFVDASDASSLGTVRDILRKYDIRSLLIVPVVVDDWVIGSFSLDSIGSARAFTQDETTQCSLFADQVAMTIKSIQRLDQLESVRRVTLALASSYYNKESLLSTIIEQAITLLKAKGGGLYEYNAEKEILKVIADHEQRRDVLYRTLKVGEGMAGRLVSSGAPFMIVDNYHEWSGRAGVYRDKCPFGAVVEVPLRWQDQTLGVLYVDDDPGPRFFLHDAALLRLFADHAAVALLSMRKLSRLEQVSKSSEEIMADLGTIPLDKRLNLITEEATKILEAEMCRIYLRKGENVLSLAASYGHQKGKFKLGQEHIILQEKGTDLTSYIAYGGKLFSACGEDLASHPAYQNQEPYPGPSSQYHSLLMVPLNKKRGKQEEILGWLRADNKKGQDGKPGPGICFNLEDEWISWLFSDATVAAIEASNLIMRLERTRRASQAIARAGFLENLDSVLTEIVWIMKDTLDCDIVTLLIYDEKKGEIAFPPVMAGVRLPNEVIKKGKLSTGSVAYQILNLDNLHDGLYIAEDVESDPILGGSSFTCVEDVVSEVAVQLRARGNKVGIMFVNHRTPHHFSDSEREDIRYFADMASAIIYEALRDIELERVRESESARTFLAWRGMQYTRREHEVRNRIQTIRENSDLIRQTLEDELVDELKVFFEAIERNALWIIEQPIPHPLSSETMMDVPINEYLVQQLERLGGYYEGIDFKLRRMTDETVTIRADPEWFRGAIDVVIDNAYHAMRESPKKEIFVFSRVRDSWVEISIRDTGPGMPAAVLQQLFRGPVPPEYSSGSGIGLLMAQVIIATYGGEIEIVKTGSDGTTVLIRLPLVS